MISKLIVSLFVAFACNATLHVASALAQAPDRTTLPMPLSKFEGKIGKTYKESESAWQHPLSVPNTHVAFGR